MTPQPDNTFLSDAMKAYEGKSPNDFLEMAFESGEPLIDADTKKSIAPNFNTRSARAVVDEIIKEHDRAKSMYPKDFVNQHEAYAVILEEVDELWDEIKKNQRNYDLSAQRKEAIQAAAMLVRLIVELL